MKRMFATRPAEPASWQKRWNFCNWKHLAKSENEFAHAIPPAVWALDEKIDPEVRLAALRLRDCYLREAIVEPSYTLSRDAITAAVISTSFYTLYFLLSASDDVKWIEFFFFTAVVVCVLIIRRHARRFGLYPRPFALADAEASLTALGYALLAPDKLERLKRE